MSAHVAKLDNSGLDQFVCFRANWNSPQSLGRATAVSSYAFDARLVTAVPPLLPGLHHAIPSCRSCTPTEPHDCISVDIDWASATLWLNVSQS